MSLAEQPKNEVLEEAEVGHPQGWIEEENYLLPDGWEDLPDDTLLRIVAGFEENWKLANEGVVTDIQIEEKDKILDLKQKVKRYIEDRRAGKIPAKVVEQTPEEMDEEDIKTAKIKLKAQVKQLHSEGKTEEAAKLNGELQELTALGVRLKRGPVAKVIPMEEVFKPETNKTIEETADQIAKRKKEMYERVVASAFKEKGEMDAAMAESISKTAADVGARSKEKYVRTVESAFANIPQPEEKPEVGLPETAPEAEKQTVIETLPIKLQAPSWRERVAAKAKSFISRFKK